MCLGCECLWKWTLTFVRETDGGGVVMQIDVALECLFGMDPDLRQGDEWCVGFASWLVCYLSP